MGDSQSYLRMKNAAEFLGVPEATLGRWGREGKIVSYRLAPSGHHRYRRADLERLRQEHGGDAPGSPHAAVWRVVWEEEGYPYTTLPGHLALRLDTDREEPWSSEELDLLLGWFGRYPLPCLSADELAGRFLPGVSRGRLREHLTAHPAFTTFSSGDPGGVSLFVPRAALVQRLLRAFLAWCSLKQPVAPARFAGHVSRMLAPPGYELEPKQIFAWLEGLGLADRVQDEWILSRPRSLVQLYLALNLSGALVARWSPFPAARASMEPECPEQDLAEARQRIWEELSPKERSVVEERLLHGTTLEQLGSRWGVSRERVRQIEKKSLEKLRAPASLSRLGYLMIDAARDSPSARLVYPERLAARLSPPGDARVGPEGVERILKACYGVAPQKIYEDQLWWLGVEEGNLLEPPDWRDWLYDDQIPPEAFRNLALHCGVGGLTTAEIEALYRCASRLHEQPAHLKACLIRALKSLDRPAHYSEIAARVRELFPARSDVTTHNLHSALGRGEPEIVWTGRRGIYSLAEWDARRRERSEPDAPRRDAPWITAPGHPEQLTFTEVLFGPASQSHDGAGTGLCVFTGLDPGGDEEALRAAVRSVVVRLQALPAPRSLCEIRASDADYQWLCQWARDLARETVRSCLAGHPSRPAAGSATGLSRSEAIGCLLLLLASEAARREAREGHVWPAVHEKFAADTRPLLFARGQPTRWHKDAIEAAARRLGLRHVFGQEGTQCWYDSIYLQFGFTRRGIAKLPLWLTGHAGTEAIQHLLDGAAGAASETFWQLWSALRDYRRSRITDHRFRQLVRDNPWVLPEWVSELMARSREKPELDRAVAASSIQDRAASAPFLTPPQLRWHPPAEPHFVCEVECLEALDLTAPRYHLRAGGTSLAVLLRQPDETYRPDPLWIRLPCSVGQLVLALVEETGLVQSTHRLDLWDAAEEITAYELPSGRRIDPWQDRMSPRKSYALLAAPDLELNPRPLQWRHLGEQARTLYLLLEGWSPDLQILLEGQVFWTPHIGPGPRSTAVEPEWAQPVRLRASSAAVALGQHLKLVVTGLPAETEVTFVRLGGRPLEFEREAEATAVAPVEATPELAAARPELVLGLRCGSEQAMVRRSVPLAPLGAARLTERGWETLSPEEPLSVQEAQTQPFRLFLPERWQERAFRGLALLEGSIFSRRLRESTGPLGTLAGFGAPLTIRYPYNWIEEESLITLSHTVMAPGVIREVVDRPEGRLQIHLRQRIAPGAEHQVVCWGPGSRLRIMPAEGIIALEPTLWRVESEAASAEGWVVAVAFAGARLGAAWPEDLDPLLNPRGGSGLQPRTTAALLRWMHLPILGPACFPVCCAWARRYPAETLAAWLLDEGLPEGLCFPSAGEEWVAVVRRIFADWQADSGQARAIVEALAGDDPSQPLVSASRHLLRADPLLLGRTALTWLRDGAHSHSDRSAGIAQIERLRRHVAGAAEEAPDTELRRRQEEILGQAATAMGVDEQFLEAGIVRRATGLLSGEALSPVDSGNLAVALGVAPFREYLGLRVLEKIGFLL